MILPLLLLAAAVLAAALATYGTNPAWVDVSHGHSGLQLILWSRRMEWPLVAVALVMSVGLIALVISGRRRAWWLVGLTPVLVLFLHRFQADRARSGDVAEDPKFVEAARATALADDDWVVGLTFGDVAYAYPYAALFRSPVVLQADHDRRMVLLWSAYANRVVAFQARGEWRGRDLEVVSTPADAPVLYNGRTGQFVNAVTGLTSDGQKPVGLGNAIPVTKTTWRQWRQSHPGGRVWAAGLSGPGRPILPKMAAATAPQGVQPAVGGERRTRVTVIGTTRPAVVDVETIGTAPINLRADGEPVLVFRPAPGLPARAFGRRFGDDIRSRFEAKRDARNPDVVFRDVDTATLWNANGLAVGGNPQFRGKRLASVAVDEGVDWGVLKYWQPGLELAREPAAVATGPDVPAVDKVEKAQIARARTKSKPTKRR